MNERMIDLYMSIAKQCSYMSRARRLQVGAVIVKNNNIISFSWNGTPAGWDNNCEYEEEVMISEYHKPVRFEKTGQLKTRPEVIHAESNAISKLAKTSGGGDGATMFITHAPCMDCAKLIYQSGVNTVYFGEYYRDTSGIDFLKKCGIQIEKFPQDN